MIYLYVKQHIDTKLLYFGKTQRNPWSKFAENYPKEFRDFFNEYTEKFGDEAWDNSYLLKRFDNPMRRASIKDVYENINGVFVEQDYSEVPIDETIKSYKNYDYISSKDEYGNILSENVIDTNLFLGLQAKGLGT